jgi:phytol kinase
VTDELALLISFAYVFAILALAESIRRWHGYGVEFTRKVIHIGVGMWVFGTVALFQRWQMAVIPALAFVVFNYLSYSFDLLKAMETGETGSLGTVYFPVAFAALIALLWSRPVILAASLMPMTWGDAMGAIIGQRWGLHRLALNGRSLEGSAAVFAFSLISVALTLTILGGMGAAQSLGISALVAVAATVVELISPGDVDNLTVPAISALVLWALLR